MSRRDNLDALPFNDYADAAPNGQLRISDGPPNRRMTYRDLHARRTFVYCPTHAPSPAALRPSVRDPFEVLSDVPTADPCTLGCNPRADEVLP